jgi:2-amino-4-hydroxy-6-hydroxymethyldihydropteridine diphosphokinase
VTETPNPNIVDTDTLTGEMHPIRRCVLAIGSNLGDRLGSLQGAVNSLADTPEVWLTAVSPIYETEPVGAPAGSKNFLNAVVLIDTTSRRARCSTGRLRSRTRSDGSAPAPGASRARSTWT